LRELREPIFFGSDTISLFLILSLLREVNEQIESGNIFNLLFPRYSNSRDEREPICSGSSVMLFPLRSNDFNFSIEHIAVGKEFKLFSLKSKISRDGKASAEPVKEVNRLDSKYNSFIKYISQIDSGNFSILFSLKSTISRKFILHNFSGIASIAFLLKYSFFKNVRSMILSNILEFAQENRPNSIIWPSYTLYPKV